MAWYASVLSGSWGLLLKTSLRQTYQTVQLSRDLWATNCWTVKFFRVILKKCPSVKLSFQQSNLFWHLDEKFFLMMNNSIILQIIGKFCSKTILHGFLLLFVHGLRLVLGARNSSFLFSYWLLFFIFYHLIQNDICEEWFFNFFFFSSGTYSSVANSVDSFLLSFLHCKYYDKTWIIRLEPLILFSNLSCRGLELVVNL